MFNVLLCISNMGMGIMIKQLPINFEEINKSSMYLELKGKSFKDHLGDFLIREAIDNNIESIERSIGIASIRDAWFISVSSSLVDEIKSLPHLIIPEHFACDLYYENEIGCVNNARFLEDATLYENYIIVWGGRSGEDFKYVNEDFLVAKYS